MTAKLFQVDAFTSTIFAGNPAAVVFLDDTSDDRLLTCIAAEMNLSETAFPVLREDGDWDLRWFTPEVEVDLCGHATLAAAHIVFQEGLAESSTLTFHTRSGPLHCERHELGIAMEFPASPPRALEPVLGLSEALGTEIIELASDFDIVALVESPARLLELTPDFAKLAEIETRAVIVTAQGDIDGGPADFVSRVFAPRVGVPEDPVTGSSHCILGPWWSERLNATELLARQVSSRGGSLQIEMKGASVSLIGQAITVFKADLNLA